MDTSTSHPVLNFTLLVMTVFCSLWTNLATNLDIVLSLITKILPCITFAFYLLINLRKIEAGAKDFIGRFKNLFKKKKK